MRIKVPAQALDTLFSRHAELTEISGSYAKQGHPAAASLASVCETLKSKLEL